MKDLNFFENYVEKSEIKIDKRIIFYSVAVILTLFVIIYTISSQIRIRSLTRDIAKLKLTVEDERLNKKIEEIREKEEEVAKFNEAVEKIKTFDEIMEEESIVDTYLLEDIVSRMPEDIFFTSISVYTGEIQIVGNAKDKWTIAQFGKNLESIEDFNEIFISNISSEEGYYNFILNIYSKDVNMDNGETNDEEIQTEEETNEGSDEE